MENPPTSEEAANSQLQTLNAYSGFKFLFLAVLSASFAVGWHSLPWILAVIDEAAATVKATSPEGFLSGHMMALAMLALISCDLMNQIRVINNVFVLPSRQLPDQDHLKVLLKYGRMTGFNWINIAMGILLGMITIQFLIYTDEPTNKHGMLGLYALIALMVHFLALNTNFFMFLISPLIRNQIRSIRDRAVDAASLDHVSLANDMIGVVGLAKALLGVAAKDRGQLQILRKELGMKYEK